MNNSMAKDARDHSASGDSSRNMHRFVFMPHQDRSSGQLLTMIFPLRPYSPLTNLTEIEVSSKVFRHNAYGIQYVH